MDYIGHSTRVSSFKTREVINESFKLFCDENDIKIPENYRQIRPTLEAGYVSAAKYDRSQPHLEEDIWMEAGEWTKEHFFISMGGAEVLTQDTVVKALDLTTSCGYPWSLEYTGKASFLASPAAGAVEDYWNNQMIADDPDMKPIWTISQKRELRHIAKVESKNHRTFTASPIELTIAGNRLCLDANEKFYDGHNVTWSSVGFTKFIGGWNALYIRLCKHKNAYELDESNYDASMFARALYGQRDIRWEMYLEKYKTSDNWKRLNSLYDEIVHSVLILENGELNQKHTGNPSGGVNTVVDNTMVLYRLFAYAWIKLSRDNPDIPPSREYFEENVEAALYGDDNSFTTSDVVKWFNPPSVATIWSEIGVITKTPCDEPREVSQITFLSNGFRYDEAFDMVLPCPDTDKVLGSLMYGSALNDVRWHFLRACALRLDSFGNKECRIILSDYIKYLNRKYRDQLHGVVIRGGVSVDMKEIRAVWKSDEYIAALYSGKENNEVVDVSAHQHLINLIKHDNEDDEYIDTLTEIKQTMTRSKKVKIKTIVKGAGVAVDTGKSIIDIIKSFMTKKHKKRMPGRARSGIAKRYNATALSNRGTVNSEYLPISSGITYRNRQKQATTVVDFDTCTMPICTSAAGVVQFGANASGVFNLELDPNYTVAGNFVFGKAVASMSFNFKQYRIERLAIEYCPIANVNTVGALAMVCTNDGATPSGTAQTFGDIMSSDGAMLTPVWTRQMLPRPHYNRTWLYVNDPAGATQAAAERQTNAGSISIVSGGNTTASQTYGYLRFIGRIRFIDMTGINNVVPNPAATMRLLEQKHDDEEKHLDDEDDAIIQHEKKKEKNQQKYGIDYDLEEMLDHPSVGDLNEALAEIQDQIAHLWRSDDVDKESRDNRLTVLWNEFRVLCDERERRMKFRYQMLNTEDGEIVKNDEPGSSSTKPVETPILASPKPIGLVESWIKSPRK